MTFDGAVFDVNYFLIFVNIDDIIFGQKRLKNEKYDCDVAVVYDILFIHMNEKNS